MPGDGAIDFEPIFRKLNEIGYDDWMIIEAEQDPGVANPYEYAKKGIQYIDGVMAKLNSEG